MYIHCGTVWDLRISNKVFLKPEYQLNTSVIPILPTIFTLSLGTQDNGERMCQLSSGSTFNYAKWFANSVFLSDTLIVG